MPPTSPSQHSEVTLPTRHASVTVLDQVDEIDESALRLAGRESLENTRSFYGARPTSPPNNGSAHRPPSVASRLTNPRSRARSNSHLSANSRSTTPSGGPVLLNSPPRSSVPLPTPRGFLSPKKAAAALRLERRRGGPSSVSSFSTARPRDAEQTHVDGSEVLSDTMSQDEHGYEPSIASNLHAYRPEPSTGTMTPEPPQSLHTPLEADGGEEVLDIPAPTGPTTGTELASGLRNAHGWDRSLRHSVTTASTPPHRLQPLDMSSDDLVPQDTEKHPPSDPLDRHLRGRNKLAKSEQRRNYKSFDNPLSKFICGGNVFIGGDHWYGLGLALLVLLGSSGVWLGTTGAWMWSHGSEYGINNGGGVAATIIFVYLFATTTSTFIVTALRDPGILPRGLDPDPPMSRVDDWWEPYPRELTVNDGHVTVKYCETCLTYRPPRCSHCRLCGNCVDGIDHHCTYLHTCVGKRNYFSFIVLLISASIFYIYITVFSAVHFALLCHHDDISFARAIQESPGAAVSFLMGVGSVGPVLFLLQFHIRLLLFNLTTLEQIRANTSNSLCALPQRPDNPFARPNTWANVIAASIGRPQFPSWIDPTGWEHKDHREVNPALRKKEVWE